MYEILFTTKGFDLSLVTQRPIAQDVQKASGTSQEYFFRRGHRDPKFDNIVCDFAQGFELAYVIVLNRVFLWAESVCPNNFRQCLSSLMSLIMAFLTHSWFLLTTVDTQGDLFSSSDTGRPLECWYPRSNNLP